MPPKIHVVAGVLLNAQGEYLLSSRPEGKPYAGYWEFAGGKVEAGETEFAALQREFNEELGIEILAATPWLTKFYQYEHAHVHLRFFRVHAHEWRGELQSREGQQWAWQRAGDYTVSPMLPANTALLAALAVPTQFSGSLKTRLVGRNNMGKYRVAPYASAEPQHENVLLTFDELQRVGKLPEKRSVWVAVENVAQFQAAMDADVLVWQVNDERAAQAVLDLLKDGVSQPLVVYADKGLCERFAADWSANGAQAVVLACDVLAA